VPPGVATGQVEVVDVKGLTKSKQAEIRRPSYNLLSIAVRPETSRVPTPSFEITVAVAEPRSKPLKVEVSKGETTVEVKMIETSQGRWSGTWAPERRRRPEEGEWRVRAAMPGVQASTVATAVKVLAPPKPAVVEKKMPPIKPRPAVPTAGPRRLRWNVALATGLVHNTGDLVSPHIGAEVGADYPLGPGRIGARLFVGFAWASQDVPLAGHEPAEASVLLAPMGVGITYGVPKLWWRLSPYAMAGLVAQVVRSRSESEQTGQRARSDVALGGLWLGGVGLALGPGDLFLQLGYLWSRVDNQDLELLAGGVLLGTGYRLLF
jgi:hypothetical protein